MLYRLEGPKAPWGDYGNILLHGMSMHLARDKGKIQLERTGPFMPPITFPGAGDIVIKGWLRERLVQAGLKGVSFNTVIKKHIARVDWHLWDRSAAEPPEYPESGEPEDYILGQPHSESCSRMIAEVFELVPIVIAKIDRSHGFRVIRGSWGDVDIFQGHGAGFTFLSERARDWFASTVGEYVSFEGVELV
jgi:hypothetical protein